MLQRSVELIVILARIFTKVLQIVFILGSWNDMYQVRSLDDATCFTHPRHRGSLGSHLCQDFLLATHADWLKKLDKFLADCFWQSNLNWDQLWGLLSRRLSQSTNLLDANSVCSLLEEELQKTSMRTWVNGEINVSCLRNYRDWKGHFERYSPISSIVLGPCSLKGVLDFLFH